MKKLLFLLFVFSFVQLVVYAQNLPTEYWEKVSENNYADMYGVTGTLDRYGFSFLLKSYNKGQYEPVNGRKISYTISTYTIDCDKYSYKIGTMDSYNDKNDFITGDYNKYAKFQPIVSGTAVGEMAKKLCKIRN